MSLTLAATAAGARRGRRRRTRCSGHAQTAVPDRFGSSTARVTKRTTKTVRPVAIATWYGCIGGVMADWSDRSVRQITLFRQGKAVPAYQYEATAQPSGIVFRFILTPAERALDVVDGETEQWAAAFNQKSLVSGVEGISTYTDVNASDQFIEKLLVTVVSDSGLGSEVLEMPQSYLQQDIFAERVSAARAYLNSVEAGG